MQEEIQHHYLPYLLAFLFISILLFSSLAREEFAGVYSAFFPVSAERKSLDASLAAPPAPIPTPPDPVPSVPLRPELPALGAAAYFVRPLDSEAPLLAERSSKPLAPASITKLLTVLIAAESILPEETVSFSQNAKNAGEKISYAPAGEEFSRDGVISFALIESDNDAAYALAERVGRKKGADTFQDAIELFVHLMNEKARALGLLGSNFKNPAGLDENGHVMSAEDVAALMGAVARTHPELLHISRTETKKVRSVDGKLYTLHNTNELLKEFPEITGSKTGLTDKAKGTLVMLYAAGGRPPVAIVILGSDDRFGDGRKIIEWIKEYEEMSDAHAPITK